MPSDHKPATKSSGATSATEQTTGLAFLHRAAPPLSFPTGKLDRQAVLVLGMHRSGTSALTEVLSLLGGRLPARLMPPARDNARGYFEPLRIVEIHDRLLASAGTSWLDWDKFPESWYGTLEADDYVQELSEAVESDYGDARVFLLKDPRICRFLPLWTRVLKQIGAEPIVVLPFRHPLEVAASLRERDGFSLAHGLLLWLRHVLDAEFASREHSRAFLSYDRLLNAGRQEISQTEAHIPVAWPRRSSRADYEVIGAIAKELRHNRASADDLISSPDVFSWVRDAYDAYEHLRNKPLDSEALEKLDGVRDQFNQACEAFTPAFQGLQIQVEQQSAEIIRSTEELAAMYQKNVALENLAANIPRLQHGLAQSEASRQAVGQELSRLVSRVVDLERSLAAESNRAERLQAEALRVPNLERNVTETSALNGELTARLAMMSLVEQERDALSAEVTALSARIGELLPLVDRLFRAEATLNDEAARADRAEATALRVPDLQFQISAARAEASRATELAECNAAALTRSGERIQLLEFEVQRTAREVPYSKSWWVRALRYIWWGITLQGRANYRAERLLRQRVRLVSRSGVFDPDWYLRTYADVKAGGLDPIEHYCAKGFLEDRFPGPNVDHAAAIAFARRLQRLDL